MFRGVTLPPYRILVEPAIVGEIVVARTRRIVWWVAAACAIVADFPVPIAQIGSYATVIPSKASAVKPDRLSFNC